MALACLRDITDVLRAAWCQRRHEVFVSCGKQPSPPVPPQDQTQRNTVLQVMNMFLSLEVKMWKEATVRAAQAFFLFKLSFQVEAGRERIRPACQTIHQLTKQRAINHRLQFNKASGLTAD